MTTHITAKKVAPRGDNEIVFLPTIIDREEVKTFILNRFRHTHFTTWTIWGFDALPLDVKIEGSVAVVTTRNEGEYPGLWLIPLSFDPNNVANVEARIDGLHVYVTVTRCAFHSVYPEQGARIA